MIACMNDISSSRILSMQYYKMKDMHNITFDIMIKYDAIYSMAR